MYDAQYVVHVHMGWGVGGVCLGSHREIIASLWLVVHAPRGPELFLDESGDKTILEAGIQNTGNGMI